jgi:hypothetical protein
MLAIIKLHMCKCVNLLASLEVEIMKCPLTNATSCAEKYSKAGKFKISNRNMKFIESKSSGGRPNRHRPFTINKVEDPAEVEKRLRTCLVSFKNYLQEGQYNHLKTAVKGTFTVFPKSPTFV